jgi:hypothetical protein
VSHMRVLPRNGRVIRSDLLEILADGPTEHVVTRYRRSNCNLRTQLERIINRAGLQPWPRMFQNLRATRETELTQGFPLHVVTAWIGNTPRVASRHYLQVRDSDFERASQAPRTLDNDGPKAAHRAAQQGVEIARNNPQVTDMVADENHVFRADTANCKSLQVLAEQGNGQGRIRTYVVLRQRVYSPLPLAARAPVQRPGRGSD